MGSPSDDRRSGCDYIEPVEIATSRTSKLTSRLESRELTFQRRRNTRYPNAANAARPAISRITIKVDLSRLAAAMPVSAFRIRGTAAWMPVTSGGSTVGGAGSGVGTAVGEGVTVGVGELVGVGLGVGVGSGVEVGVGVAVAVAV